MAKLIGKMKWSNTARNSKNDYKHIPAEVNVASLFHGVA